MRRHGIASPVLGLALLVLSGRASADVPCSVPCGEALGPQYLGVYPLSNGPEQGTPTDCANPATDTGDQYQCVELVTRFYHQVFHVNTSAPSWLASAAEYLTTAPLKGLKLFANAASLYPPVPGDIIVFSTFGTDTYGHVAIISAVRANEVDILEQNYLCSGTITLSLSQNGDGTWTIGPRPKGQPVAAWLRLSSNIGWTETSGPDLTNSSFTGGIATTSQGEVFASTSQTCQASNSLGVFRSTDQGSTWNHVNLGLTSTNVYSLTVSSAGTVFAGTHDGVFRYDRTLGTWEPSGLSGTTITMIIGTNGGLFAADGCYCHGLYQSFDEGSTWQPTAGGLPGCVNVFIQDAAGNSFAGTGTNGVFKMPAGGTSWQAMNSGLPTSDVHRLALDSSGDLLMGGPAGLFRLSNGATQWRPLTGGLPTDGIQAIAATSGATLFVGTFASGIYASTDNGTSWTADNSGIANTSPTVGAFAFDAQGNLYTSVGSIVYRSSTPVQ